MSFDAIDQDIQSKLDYEQCFAFTNFKLLTDPMIYEFSDIDLPPSNNPITRGAQADYFSLFAAKNFIKPRQKNNLLISFVMKKKIGNAVKRNKIRRKLKAIVQKLLKKRGAINKDYTYIVFGKSNAYAQKQDVLLPLMEKSFSKLKK